MFSLQDKCSCVPAGPEQSRFCKLRCCYARCSCKLDLAESDMFHQPDQIPDRDRAPDSIRPCRKTVCDITGQVGLSYDISKLEASSRPQHSVYLFKTLFLVGGEIQHTV